MLQVADLAFAFDRSVSVMNCPGNFLAHVAAALPNHIGMEVVDTGRDVCFSVDNRIEDGFIVLGDSPGNGIVFDEEKLKSMEVDQLTPRTTAGSWGRRRGAGLYEVPTRESGPSR